ncbi:MAG: hypothetical protein ABEH60_06915, partial [Halonotius sp.]
MSSEQPDEESTADVEAAGGATGGDSDAVGGISGDEDGGVEPEGAPDIGDLDDRLDDLRAEFDEFEADIDDRTVEKPAVEAD